jgi:transposase-like protein
MSDSELIEACPRCDSSKLIRRRHNPETTRYKCRTCKHEFNDARKREKKREHGHRTGLAGELDDMHPDNL